MCVYAQANAIKNVCVCTGQRKIKCVYAQANAINKMCVCAGQGHRHPCCIAQARDGGGTRGMCVCGSVEGAYGCVPFSCCPPPTCALGGSVLLCGRAYLQAPPTSAGYCCIKVNVCRLLLHKNLTAQV